jgi:L-alanine-DL-glutamate epimerase-like enolase superfamily enzyme
VAALRQAVGPEARIRLDANGAWSAEMARDALRELSRFDLEYVEDPLRVRTPDDVEALASLRGESPVSLAADDCLWDPACASAMLACRAVDRFVLKAAPLGGLAATRELARRARERGIDSVVTSTMDAAVGLTASLHLAAALGAESACGLGTAAWLAEDVATPPRIEAGQMSLPRGSGLGIDVPERADG